MKYVLALCLLTFSIAAFADWESDFEALKSVPRSYEPAGAICEEIRRLDVLNDYPAPRYEVINGIEYSDGQRTIGELDVVVFDKDSGNAVQVNEVKCWRDLGGGLVKATDQQNRFLGYMKKGGQLYFKSTTTGQQFDRGQFVGVKDFVKVGQKGSVKVGFNKELSYTLVELKQHSAEMKRCQNQGLCAVP